MLRTRLLQGAGMVVAALAAFTINASAQNQTQPPNGQAPRFETDVIVSSVTVLQSKRPGEYLLSFNTPIGLPGVSLGTGTYLFRFVGERRNTIQVLSADGTRSYGLFNPGSIRRTGNTNQAAVWLIEPATDGGPRRIQALFQPGESIGSEFLYVRKLLSAAAGSQ